MLAGQSDPPLRIGDWVLDPSIDTIVRGGEVQKLEPRTTRLLLLLAGSPGSVVSVDRILSEVWAGVIVGPASAYQAVSRLRRLLGDTDPEPTYIATIPRKGYRLIAQVSRVEAQEPSARPDLSAKQPDPAASVGRRPPQKPEAPGHQRRIGFQLRIGLALVLFLFIAGGVWTWRALHSASTATTAPASIVVLPFIDMTAEKQDQAFCDGLTEELSNWLAQIPGLRVVARTSAFAYLGRPTDVRAIGRQLGTTHVLEGSVRRSGAQLRITTQLINTADGYHLWSASFDRAVDDVVKVQEEIARSVADNLEIRLGEQTAQRFEARTGAVPEAYQLYLLAGRYRHALTRDSNNQAIEQYQQALALDPRFALAYAALATAYLNQLYLNGRSISEVSEKVEPLLTQGLRLNADLPELYTARGALRADQHRTEEALHDLRHAIELNPNNSSAFAEMGYLLIINGRPREALENYSAAARLDPLDYNIHTRRCVALTDMARFDEAEAACTHARSLSPNGSWPDVATSWLDWARGRINDALRWNALAIKASPNEFDLYDDRASLFLALNMPGEARQALDKARQLIGPDERIALRRAQVSFYEGGAAALRAQLAGAAFDSSENVATLLRAARLSLLLGDTSTARRLLNKGVRLAGAAASNLDFPWYERQGESGELTAAMVELAGGDRAAAQARLRALSARITQLQQAGLERFGLYTLLAQISSLRGDPSTAMRSLHKATDLGWRATAEAIYDPAYASLQSRSDFRSLVERLERETAPMRVQASRAADGGP